MMERQRLVPAATVPASRARVQGSVHFGILWSVGKVERLGKNVPPNATATLVPQVDLLQVVKHIIGRRREGQPTSPMQFLIELPFPPPGIPGVESERMWTGHESMQILASQCTEIDPGHDTRFVEFWIGVERHEWSFHGPPDVDGLIGRAWTFPYLSPQFPESTRSWPIENQPKGPFDVMLDDEDHGAVEIRVVQPWGGDEQMSAQR